MSGTGVLTKRDELCVHFDERAAYLAAKDIATQPKEYVVEKYHVKSDVRDWKYDWAKQDVIRSGVNSTLVRRIAYRPLDYRYAYYTGESRGFMGWPVYTVMQHMLNAKNIALVTARSNKSGDSSHFFVSDALVEYKCGERTTNSSVFPLYVVDDGLAAGDIRPNFNQSVVDEFEEKTGMTYDPANSGITNADEFGPYALFAYIYACLHSSAFREKNKEFINRGFPVVPYPSSQDAFHTLAELGNELVTTHLLCFEIEESNQFYGEDRHITSISLKDGSAFINKSSHFVGVDERMWKYTIGGYQPCQRWLKDRKGRVLDEADILAYRKLLHSVAVTRLIVGRIDEYWSHCFPN